MQIDISALPVPTAVIAPDGTVSAWNAAAEDLFGTSASEMVGSPASALFVQELPSIFAALAKGGWVEVEFRDRQSLEQTIRVSRILQAEEHEAGAIFVFSGPALTSPDPDALRSGTAAAVTRLGSGIAHDFNGVLQVISGRASLLKATPALPNELREDVDEITRACERGAALVRRLRAFGRDAGNRSRRVSVDEIVLGVEWPVLDDRRVDTDIRVSVGADGAEAVGDPAHIEQALINLVLHLRDTMPKGGMISVSTKVFRTDREFLRKHPFADAGEYIFITFCGEGPTITGSAAAHLLELRYGGNDTARGTGLCLAMAYAAVKQIGGFMIARSESAHVSEFSILLPLAPARVTA